MLVSDSGHIKKLKFRYFNKKYDCYHDYRIIQTKRGSNNSVWAARDEVINETLNFKKWFTRRELKNYFNQLESNVHKNAS